MQPAATVHNTLALVGLLSLSSGNHRLLWSTSNKIVSNWTSTAAFHDDWECCEHITILSTWWRRLSHRLEHVISLHYSTLRLCPSEGEEGTPTRVLCSVPWSYLTDAVNVAHVDLSNNFLTNVLPSSGDVRLGDQFPHLEHIDFSRNHLQGTSIPESVGQLASLKRIHLSENQLIGTIPTVLGNLHELELLDLSSNDLSGSLPSELGLNTHLESLMLDENALEGFVPLELSNLSTLSKC